MRVWFYLALTFYLALPYPYTDMYTKSTNQKTISNMVANTGSLVGRNLPSHISPQSKHNHSKVNSIVTID
jgi:hypothetical protein